MEMVPTNLKPLNSASWLAVNLKASQKTEASTYPKKHK